MQKDIMTNGPIQEAFMVYKSFMSYKSGVYKKHFWEILPAVKIIGWGTEDGHDYWLVANSWGTTSASKVFSRLHVASTLAAWKAWGLHTQVCHHWGPTASISSKL